MKRFCTAVVILGMAAPALAGESLTALEAMKLLPPAKAARIAWIEGRDGDPDPKRWYLIVQDEFEENGFREFVVTGGAVAASRPVSQFVTSLTPDDIVGLDSIKVDSSRAARIAREYAAANDLKFSKLNFELKKAGDVPPVWKVTCLDDADKAVGEVTLTALKGDVVSHEGFAKVPSDNAAKAVPATAAVSRKKRKMELSRPVAIAERPGSSVAAYPSQPPTPEKKPGAFSRFINYISH